MLNNFKFLTITLFFAILFYLPKVYSQKKIVNNKSEIVIFINSINCLDCIKEIPKKIKLSDYTSITVLLSCDTSFLNKRNMINNYKKYFKKETKFLFDEYSLNDKKKKVYNDSSLFSKYKIHQTPCYMTVNKSDSIFHSFKEIFGS